MNNNVFELKGSQTASGERFYRRSGEEEGRELEEEMVRETGNAESSHREPSS